LQAAADFERAASPRDSAKAFGAAIERWPAEPVAWIGRGTAEYRAGNFVDAARDYASAVRADSTHAGARNNLSQALLDLGCPRAARAQIRRLDASTLGSPLREAVSDTRQHAEAAAAASATDDPAICATSVNGL
jgi:predicted aconitase